LTIASTKEHERRTIPREEKKKDKNYDG